MATSPNMEVRILLALPSSQTVSQAASEVLSTVEMKHGQQMLKRLVWLGVRRSNSWQLVDPTIDRKCQESRAKPI